jgi:uncharacterized RDD family membrane protein YckC
MDEPRPGGFWIRAASALADFGVFFIVQVSLGYVAALAAGPGVDEIPGFLPLVWAFTLLFAALYTTALHARAGGQTLGKMLMGVHVTGVDGRPLSVGAAFLRFLGYFASLGCFGMGFVMAGLRRDKRALHDLLAGSSVVRGPRATSPARQLSEAPGPS